jgi:hypothetical protein
MKTALLSIALALCVCSPVCRADFIVGSVDFSLTLVPTDPSVGLDRQQELTDLKTGDTTTGFFSQSGGFPEGTPWGSFTLPDFAAIDKSLTISNADFGTFNASILNDQLIPSGEPVRPVARVVRLLGTWIPGTNPRFAGYTDPVVAEMTLSLITTSLNSTSAVSESMVFAAYGAAVPEPGSLLLLGAVSIAVPLRRRLKRRVSVPPTGMADV